MELYIKFPVKILPEILSCFVCCFFKKVLQTCMNILQDSEFFGLKYFNDCFQTFRRDFHIL